MNVNQYIKSGKIEAYLHGHLSYKEAREVEGIAQKHPEISERLETLKSIIGKSGIPSSPMDEVFLDKDDPKEEMASVEPTASSWGGALYSLLFALCVIGLILSMALNVYFSNRLVKEQRIVASFQTFQKNAALEKEVLMSRYNAINDQLKVALNLDYTRVNLLPFKEEFGYDAVVFWRPETSEVIIHSDNLPALREGNYQLWSIVRGVYSSVGVFSPSLELQPMSLVSEADAFAITIEPNGEREKPDISQLVILGSVPK